MHGNRMWLPFTMHRINAFEIDGKVFLKLSMDAEIYPDIHQYYNKEEHRIEVPTDEFETVRSILEPYAYEPVLVDDVTEYCVAVQEGAADRTRRFLRELFAAHSYEPVPAAGGCEYREWREEQCECHEKANAVYELEIGPWTVRVMKDRSAVERAIERGAKPLSEAGLDLSRSDSGLASPEA